MWVWTIIVGCNTPRVCRDRADDADCDGVPDGQDQCPETTYPQLTDAAGCSDGQMAGCAVTPTFPDAGDRVESPATFTWETTCDVVLVQFSDEEAFPVANTRTAIRTAQSRVSAHGDERYWRLVGGLEGRSRGVSSEARRIKWKR